MQNYVAIIQRGGDHTTARRVYFSCDHLTNDGLALLSVPLADRDQWAVKFWHPSGKSIARDPVETVNPGERPYFVTVGGGQAAEIMASSAGQAAERARYYLSRAERYFEGSAA